VKPDIRRIRPQRGSASGFTIIEVAIAATVLILAISSSLAVLQQGLRAIDTARYKTMAGQILQSQMEKLRMLNWSQLNYTLPTPTANTGGPVNYATFTTDVVGLSAAQVDRFFANGASGRFLQSIEDGPLTNMKTIKLTATWTGIDGQSHSVYYISHYGRAGLSDFFYNGSL
jgi:Tfp pilus assembly protein PilV